MNSRWMLFLPARLRQRLHDRALLRKVIGNTGWLFADRIVRLTVGLLVGVWIARYLGPAQYGLLSYALALVSLFSALATLGLDSVIVRELVRIPDRHGEILGSAFAMRVTGGLVGFALAACAGLLLRGASDPTLPLVLIIAAGFVFQSFDCIDLSFQAGLRNRASVVAKNIAFLLLAAVKVGLILMKAPLIAFAWAALAETATGAFALYLAYRLNHEKVSEWRVTWTRVTELGREGLPLLLSGLVVMIYMRIDQIMLGDMLDDTAVGIYAAATRLAEISYMIPTVVVAAAAPALVHVRESGDQVFNRKMQKLFDALTLVSYGVAAVVSLLAQPLIALLYGPEFAGAAHVLRVQIWALVFVSLGVASGQYLLLHRLNYIAFERTLIGAVVNVLLNLAVIPRYGPIGAAWATLVSFGIANFFIFRAPATRPCLRMMLRALLPVRPHTA